MLALGSLAFASPWLLAALAALPVIWWLLRVTPPAPRRIAFPALRLLLGLAPREETPARTPLWLILLRMVAGGAGHRRRWRIRCSTRRRGSPAAGRWCSSSTTAGRRRATGRRARRRAIDLLAEAEREDRQIVLVTTAPPASDQPRAAAGADPRRRCARRGRGAGSRSRGRPTARRRWRGSQALPLPAGSRRGLAQRRRRRRRRRRRSPAISPTAAACAISRRRRTMRRACSPPRGPGERAGKDLAVVVRSLPAPLPRPVAVRASAEDGALAGARGGDDRARRRAAPRSRLPMPSELRNRVTRIDIEGEASAGGGAAGRRALAPPAGRHRRRRRTPRGQPLLSETYYLERALEPVHRGAPRPRRRPAEARARGADLCRCRPGFAGRGGGASQMDRGGRRAAALRRAASRRAGATICCRCGCAAAGARSAARCRGRQPAKLAPFAADSPFAGLGDPGRRHGVAPGAGRARPRPRRQDLGAARRRHAAGHRRKARQGLDRPGPHHRQCRMVEPGAVRAVRRDAAAHRGDEPGRRRRRARRRCRRSRRSTGSAGCSARRRRRGRSPARRSPTATPSPRHPPGFYGTADARRALNLSAGDRRAEADRRAAGRTSRARASRTSAEIDIRPPLLTAALLLALVDLLIAYALRGLLRRRPARRAAAALLLALLAAAGRRGAGRRRFRRARDLRAAPRLCPDRQRRRSTR